VTAFTKTPAGLLFNPDGSFFGVIDPVGNEAAIGALAQPLRLQNLTLAQLATIGAAAAGMGAMAWCSNATPNATAVISDGATWRVIAMGATAA